MVMVDSVGIDCGCATGVVVVADVVGVASSGLLRGRPLPRFTGAGAADVGSVVSAAK